MSTRKVWFKNKRGKHIAEGAKWKSLAICSLLTGSGLKNTFHALCCELRCAVPKRLEIKLSLSSQKAPSKHYTDLLVLTVFRY